MVAIGGSYVGSYQMHSSGMSGQVLLELDLSDSHISHAGLGKQCRNSPIRSAVQVHLQSGVLNGLGLINGLGPASG